MLSIAQVRSAKGAAGYFAADNYYAAGDPAGAGEWFGQGAAALGLVGTVSREVFEALLGGELPSGGRVGVAERHAAGIDLTFSLPKSWSLLALVGGDRRILNAYRAAVKDALGWAERNALEARLERHGREQVIATGTMVAALFEHDTSRAQDPQAHVHAVIANATLGGDGKWRAIHNGRLWQLGTLLNAIAMASFRERVTALGYRAGDPLKHGNFEAQGIGREAILAFSTRRQQILAKVAELSARTPAAFDAATLMTRPAKAPVADRGALRETWSQAAAEARIDLPGAIAAAGARAAEARSPFAVIAETLGVTAMRARDLAETLVQRLGLGRPDPYLVREPHRLAPGEMVAGYAVAAALRHLEQREAAFGITDIYKAALDLGLPTAIDAVERRVDRLRAAGLLVQGTGRHERMMTTRGAMQTERAILGEIELGRGHGRAFVPYERAPDLLAETAERRSGITLNPGQIAGGTMLLAGDDRIVAIQGVAGAGKSKVLGEVANLLADGGTPVLGLAVQNTLVQMLERETGIPSMTVTRFLRGHRAILGSVPDPATLRAARRDLGGALLLVDEASMVSNADQLALVRLANRVGVGRLAFVGDARQLGAVDAGKPFSVMQQAGAATAHMPVNLRARSEAIRAAAAAAQIGSVDRAMAALAPFTVEAPGRASEEAAERWLALDPEERRRTAIYASGRRLRGEINRSVQEGLLAREEIGLGKIDLLVLDRVSLTDEQLRDTQHYVSGMIVEISRSERRQRVPRARASVVAVDHARGTVSLKLSGGAMRTLRPAKLRRGGVDSTVQLFEARPLALHERDRIRWTANDRDRGLFNADRAEIVRIDEGGVEIRTSAGAVQVLPSDDPMLTRLDLAYALNAHMAQGLTSDRGIAVMETRDARLVTQQTFLVTVTRLRDALTLIVDRAGALERQLARNPGGKTSALETTGRLQPRDGTPAPHRQAPEVQLEPGGLAKPYELGI